ncbi:MAG: hypothetical protein LAO30_24925 [Acidobacteriia bacterium]|nr:hypothetical protein [Terriglobia bacterium]
MISKSIFCVSILLLLLPVAWSQSSGAPASSSPGEVTFGGYRIHQSIEAGYRVSDETGNGSMFNTLVNEHEGPRLFGQTFSMRSETAVGQPFDDLFVNSVGWGGDPNNYLRMRVSKNDWYDFRATFRRDQDYFDFNLLANPLNPVSSTPAVAVDNSPHQFATRRRMSDVDLTLLPHSWISFRLGYSRNNMTGPSYTSMHEGTDAQLLQLWNTTANNYRLGVDFKLLKNTVLSYDQFLNYYKGDTGDQLNALPYALAGGKAVDLGLPFNTVATQPCATPLLAGGDVNPACNGYFAYTRFQASRNSFPTEQLSLRGNYFHRLEVTGSFNYSSGDVRLPVYSEFFDGLTTRSRLRTSQEGGSSIAHRINTGADAGVVLRVTDRLRVVDTFRFLNFRLPGVRDYAIGALFGATLLSTANVFDPATCPPPYTAATCPQHNSSSGADLTTVHDVNFLKQDLKSNTTELQYDLTRKISGRLGYRFQRRTIFQSVNDLQALTFYPVLPNRGACAGLPLVNGVCTTTAASSSADTAEINGHSLLAGISLRPSRELRANFDTEQFYADHSFARISPRKESRYRMSGTYTPVRWAVLGASANLLSNSNEDALTNYHGHTRNYGFNVSVNPRARFGVDLAYNYADVVQAGLICFNDTPPTGVVLPLVTNASDCSGLDPANPLLTDSYYENNTHFGTAAVMIKPAPRVTTRFGYSITSVGGKTPQFNILQPLGSLAYNYHQPVASVDVDMARNFGWHAGWNYYQYGEKDFVGPTLPRYFHANDVTLSLKYAF